MRNDLKTRVAWITAGLLSTAAFINALDRYSIVYLHDQIIRDIPMSESQFGMLSSALVWTYSAFCGASSYWADRFGRKRAIVAYVLGWSAATIWSGYATSYTGFLCARILVGLTEAGFFPASLALVCDHHSNRSRSKANAVVLSGSYLGVSLTALTGYLGSSIGWRSCCVGFGIAGIAYALILQLFLQEKSDPEYGHESRTEARGTSATIMSVCNGLMNQSRFWLFVAANAILPVGQTLLFFWLPLYLRARFHLSEGQTALPLAIMLGLNLATSIFSFTGGHWADVWSVSHRRSRIYVTAIGFWLAAPGFWVLAYGHTIAAFMAGVALIGMGIGFYSSNSMPILRGLVRRDLSATGFGIATGIGGMLCGGITYAGGALRDAHIGLNVAFEGIGVLALLGSAIVLLLKPLTDQERASLQGTELTAQQSESS